MWLASGPEVTQHTTYLQYTLEGLKELAKQTWQKPRKSIVALMLRLWDDRADILILSPEEMQQLSSITSTPAL
jgi:hypothetical protein